MTKKRIGIEALLRWTYRDELPKAQAETGLGLPQLVSAATPLNTWIGEGCPVAVDDGRENAYGVIMDRYASADPHADALAVHAAVQRLALCAIDMPEGWNPYGDMPEATWAAPSAAEALGRLVARPALLVRKHAILGGLPHWGQGAPVPEVRAVMERGKPKWFRQVQVTDSLGLPMTLEQDGYDRVCKRPFADAYKKTEVVPDPVPLAIARAEYQVWRAALDVLVADLDGALAAHDVEDSTLPFEPWVAGGDMTEPRLLAAPGWAGETTRPPPVVAGPRGPRWSGEARIPRKPRKYPGNHIDGGVEFPEHKKVEAGA